MRCDLRPARLIRRLTQRWRYRGKLSTVEEISQLQDSVAGNLPPFTWSTDEAVRYEVVLEALSQLVAACTARLTQEQAKADPDPAVIARCEELTTTFTEQRLHLRSTDQRALAEVLANAQALRQQILTEQ